MIKKDWQRVLDKYLMTSTLSSDDYENLNEAEKEFIQEIKRAFKRIQNKDENIYS